MSHRLLGRQVQLVDWNWDPCNRQTHSCSHWRQRLLAFQLICDSASRRGTCNPSNDNRSEALYHLTDPVCSFQSVLHDPLSGADCGKSIHRYLPLSLRESCLFLLWRSTIQPISLPDALLDIRGDFDDQVPYHFIFCKRDRLRRRPKLLESPGNRTGERFWYF